MQSAVKLTLVALAAAAVATTVTRCSMQQTSAGEVDPSHSRPADQEDRMPGPGRSVSPSRTATPPSSNGTGQNPPSMKPARPSSAPVVTGAPVDSSVTGSAIESNPTEIPGLVAAPSPGDSPPQPSAPPLLPDELDEPLPALDGDRSPVTVSTP